jgi:hypothetical protein
MATYRMTDGTILKTENAKASWEEATYWDGNNHCSVNTRSQWDHQKLYQSRKGRFWLECWSQWQGSVARAEWVSEHEAVRWLLANEHGLPKSLEALRAEIEE